MSDPARSGGGPAATGTTPDRPGDVPAKVRVTVAQLTVSDDAAANRATAEAAFREAARLQADLLVLPEYASAYDPRGVGAEHAEPLDGPYVSTLRRRAADTGVAVIAGVTLPARAGLAANALVVVGTGGSIAGVYRKVHLYDAFGTRESDRLEPGDPGDPPVTLSLGEFTFGVLTCYDLRFPESARRVVDAGADVLVYPAAWMAGPLKADHWHTLLRARAIENTAIVLGVGMAGKSVTGRSLLVGPDGVVGLELGDDPEIRTVDLDPSGVAAARRANPSLANRRYAVVPE
ncbi:carbon-nitrogen hydrolase family protein [Myceligenerans pegani]|uniref:Carbon-nitrogen hydrolase family protein n=1 Tax=Myceligenerans pegani TaxID=2776917 RepID=A0ABR9MW42_9MICO|nr:carbon-nitrogen hydrolase family protein [Myceligenerans sp. TRM 65318]MBE1875612.1 carbon-nitrogen hydrolase family protein [Myceligenerans sp. TRM 65318]MBE3017883.1 carbon-nitrogen hydrolase family protein [Myceligenerans sp. TRM 65318]